MSQIEIKKRERGANYTPEEKAMLTDIISKYKYIIEDKRTGGQVLSKKKEAWKAVTTAYNSNCTTGPRQVDQLKALYDNMKQKTRKNVGEKNKLEYINKQIANQHEFVTSEDLSRAIKNIKEDKVQVNKTGGGSWKPKMTDSDAKVLAIIQDQIEPLSNPYDSGAVYFKDQINEAIDEVEIVPPSDDFHRLLENDVVVQLETDVSFGSLPVVIEDHPSAFVQSQETKILTTAPDQNIITQPTKQSEIPVTPARRIRNVQDQQNHTPVTTPRTITPARRKFVKFSEVATAQKNKNKCKTAEALKRIYFKKKCQNADLERKKLMQEIMHERQQHNLKMYILKKECNKNQ